MPRRRRPATRDPGHRPRYTAGGRERHRNLRTYFGAAGVARERARYTRDVTSRYRQELVLRFLDRHVLPARGSCLEVGPGPGRFSSLLAARYPSLCLLDLSGPMLRACRRELRRSTAARKPNFVEGSAEALPFRDHSFDRVVALGVLPFVATQFARVLADLGRLLKRGGRVIFEVQSPSQATMTLLSPNPSGGRTILRAPKAYHLWDVVRSSYQPYDPAHWARFEVIWRRPSELRGELAAARLRPIDMMAIGPNFGNQPGFLRGIRRDPRAYATALEVEEVTGRWPELLGAGAATLIAAESSG